MSLDSIFTFELLSLVFLACLLLIVFGLVLEFIIGLPKRRASRNKPRTTDGYVLCQACGHIEEYTPARHKREELCSECGGEYCGCYTCSESARIYVQFQNHQPQPLDPCIDSEQVKGHAPGLSEYESSFRQTEARAKRTLDHALIQQPP